MFGNINQNKKNQNEGADKKEDVVSNFFDSKLGQQIAQQMDLNQMLVDERFMSQNILFKNQNKSLLNMFWPCEACKHLSRLDLSAFNNVWPGLNSGRAVKLLTSGEEQKNINDSSIFKRINGIKNQMKSEDKDNKNQTDFCNNQNSFEK